MESLIARRKGWLLERLCAFQNVTQVWMMDRHRLDIRDSH